MSSPVKDGVSRREYLSVVTVGYHACGKSSGITSYFQTGQLSSSRKVGRRLVSIESKAGKCGGGGGRSTRSSTRGLVPLRSTTCAAGSSYDSFIRVFSIWPIGGELTWSALCGFESGAKPP
ncbi:hypothetical protein Fot_56926 [Forsythia ovata]|uniref:Uncharacterized protein n=1 Tax=Forsythia ovata TaxID=205694 RepID=A0ABD1NXJ1_9LAMI